MVSWWFTVVLLAAVLALSLYLLKIYPSKDTPWFAYLSVFVALFLSFCIIMLIPYDVYLVYLI